MVFIAFIALPVSTRNEIGWLSMYAVSFIEGGLVSWFINADGVFLCWCKFVDCCDEVSCFITVDDVFFCWCKCVDCGAKVSC